ncbi:ArsR/SmtB family transcription factor [Methylobacterium tarhaniae]|uniref:ArsR/SmtB family transcription factor n=1 Tax=Methylobacterium tarhaniae TaxID=1187852 RepID=UPI003D07DA44
MYCRNIGAASDLLALLANPNRLGIVCLLLEGERSVMALEVALDIPQPTLSQQIGILREAGIIAGRRVARRVFYRVVDDRARRIVETLRGLFDDLLPASVILASADPSQSREALAAASAASRLAEWEAM